MQTRYQRDIRVGDYVLDAPLGAGAFGEVWRASHVNDEREKVAVKLPLEERFVGYLKREGELIRKLRSPHIVEIVACDAGHEPPYLAMELVDGPSLDRVLARSPNGIRVDDAVSVLRAVLPAMEYAHGQGVIHRDLKPANVLLDREPSNETGFNEWCVKVSDFGLGDDSPDMLLSIVQSISITRDSQLVGTLAYIAPEVRDGRRPPDARSDLYAIGVMLFEMLTGQRPSGFDLPSAVQPDVPGALDHVFRRLVCRHEQRYANAAEALHDMNQRLAFGEIDPPQRAVGAAAGAATALATGGRLWQVQIAPGIPLDLILIPAGEFAMGAAEDEGGYHADDERPQHLVRITRPFYMGRYEVTQKQWRAVMGANPSKLVGDDLPVEHVAFDDCVAFCEKLSAVIGRTVRLPHEAEWEFACRAGTTSPWNSGRTISAQDHANFNAEHTEVGRRGPSRRRTLPVGSFPPNAWGLHDMHGNVAEWCGDDYQKYDSRLRVDPVGRGHRDRRVRRGGGFDDSDERVRSAARDDVSIEYYSGGALDVGMRVVSPLEVLSIDLGDDVRIELIEILPGEFLMGSSDAEDGSNDHEGPRHRVRITRPFFMSRTPVTWAQYHAVMRGVEWELAFADAETVMRDSLRHAAIGGSWFDGLKKAAGELLGGQPRPPTSAELASYPVVRVSYIHLDAFCERLSKRADLSVRLPTEAEWEYACRAGTTSRFSVGDALGAQSAAFGATGAPWPTHPVASFAPNGWGLYDMHGLVHEICADHWGPYSADEQADPPPRQADEPNQYRVKRGGSFASPADECRSAAREYGSDNRSDTGFRIVAVPGKPG